MRRIRMFPLAALTLCLAVGTERTLQAHCDSLDGPVVNAARRAFEKGDVAPTLKWVSREREEELKAAFGRALKARSASPEAREVAELWFFETLVRLHRATEGEPYSGLVPAGSPAAALARDADIALQAGTIDELARTLSRRIEDGLRARFQRARHAAGEAEASPELGRRFVAAYVEFVHYVEQVHDLAAATPQATHGERRPHVAPER